MEVEDVELSGLSEMDRIGAIRTAATWMRQTGKPLEQYPRKSILDERMRQEAIHFATGILPWPSRWTKRLYGRAVN